MSIQWIRNVIIDGEKNTLQVQIGERRMGDKCFTRVGKETEQWFDNAFDGRVEIVRQGLDQLKTRLEGKNVTYPDGREFDWQP